jgi:hypothetical protein
MNFNFPSPRSNLTPSAHEFIPGSVGNNSYNNNYNNQPNLNVDYDQIPSMSGMNLSASSWVPSAGGISRSFSNASVDIPVNNNNINNRMTLPNNNQNNYPTSEINQKSRIQNNNPQFPYSIDPSADPYQAINEFENSGTMPSDYVEFEYETLALPSTLPAPPKRLLLL